jgi:hypothetical protein
MFEWFFLIALIFITGWILYRFAFTPLSSSAPAPAFAPTVDIRAYKPESWCFVGENTLGRYCVQSDNCGPLDKFASKDACELVEASALPLGITGEGGLHYNPFMVNENRRHTF